MTQMQKTACGSADPGKSAHSVKCASDAAKAGSDGRKGSSAPLEKILAPEKILL
jgi:hypothetical protein